jgi:hypothetical protein
MPSTAWKGFIHSWHTLAIVLKWMCITVVGIPFAIGTCLLIGAAVLLFAALALLGAAAVFACVFFVCKGIFCLVIRIPFWINEFRIRRAERRLFRLPVAEAPMQQRAGARPFQLFAGRAGARTVQLAIPPQTHIAPPRLRQAPAIPATDLPGAIECQVCLEKKLPDEFPTRQPTQACSHPVNCCKPCISQSITSAFEGRIWDDIRCPWCNIQLQHQDIADFASPDIFQR